MLRSVKDASLTRDYSHMQNRGSTKQLTQPKISISEKRREKAAFPTLNGSVNLKDVSYSSAVIQGRRRSSWGHPALAPSFEIQKGESNRDTKNWK